MTETRALTLLDEATLIVGHPTTEWIERVTSAAMIAAIEAKTVPELHEVRQKVRGVEAYIRRHITDREERLRTTNGITAPRLWIERRLGEFLAETVGGSGRPPSQKKHEGHVFSHRIPEGIHNDQSRRWQQFAAVPAKDFEAILRDHIEMGDELSTVAMLRWIGVGDRSAHQSHELNEWYTPPEWIARARAALGEIDLDPATSEGAQAIVQARRYFTKANDGLAQPWAGRVFLNPPYSMPDVAEFTGRLLQHLAAGPVPAAILLVNNATDTAWFQDALERCAAVCFPRGRVRFLDEEGEPGSPLQGQAFLYFGVELDRFIDAFQPGGTVLVNAEVR